MVRPWHGLVVTKKRYRKCDRSWECRWAIYQGLNCLVVPSMSYHGLMLGSDVLLAGFRSTGCSPACFVACLAGLYDDRFGYCNDDDDEDDDEDDDDDDDDDDDEDGSSSYSRPASLPSRGQNLPSTRDE
ncbi:hypothetical protein M0804_004010 [Polistes exclamans]|nr:hypothetical protein M0804_004010 [Polistes exclamans]